MTTSGEWSAAELARLGFTRLERVRGDLASLARQLPTHFEQLLPLVTAAADPDLALAGLVALAELEAALLPTVLADEQATGRLVAVLGGSIALHRHLITHLDAIDALLEPAERQPIDQLIARVAAAIDVTDLGQQAALDPKAADRLRLANKWELVRIAARDLTADEPAAIVADIAAELSDLADVILAGALSVARAQVAGQELTRLAIVGLGKAGAQELNYLSDVDVLFVAEPVEGADPQQAMTAATRLAAAVSRVCSANSPAGSIWTLDAALRPEGNAGPLVRTLAGHRSYYRKWAKNWEFQAMLKARPMAGDVELGQAFCELVAEGVWNVGAQSQFIPEIQALRRKVIENIPAAQRDRDIKLGEGGLRDIEFSVQLLQLVHGRTEQRLRQRGTLPALEALVELSYVGRADGALLAEAYRFERCLEHRQQLWNLQRTHLLPTEADDWRRLARQMGGYDAASLTKQCRSTTREVRALQQRIFYSPLLATVAKLPDAQLQLSEAAVADRMRALGFQDPAAALRHIEALTTGVNRRAAIQRQLMPAMLEWLSQGANPDLGMLSFRQLSEELGESSWYLRTLRDEGVAAERLAKALSSSRYLPDLLRRSPAAVRFLTDSTRLTARTRDDLHDALNQAVARHEAADDQIAALSAIRREELFRLAAGELLDVIDLPTLGAGLSDLAGASVDAGLQVARRVEQDEHPEIDLSFELAVIAMGRWGGRELSHASDLDALFVVEDGVNAEQLAAANRIVARLAQLLRRPGPDPDLVLDAGLRPEGRNGALVRTLGSYRSYYDNWSQTWEMQALLRAGFGAGDRRLADEFEQTINHLRWPERGLSQAQVDEIRRLKARMEKERAGRTADRDIKLGPGGLSDIEWTVQLLQLQHAHRIEALRTCSTLPALAAAREAGLIPDGDARALEQAWIFASRLRDVSMIVRNRPTDLLPVDPRETSAIAMLLGYQAGESSKLLDDFHRSRRHALRVVEKLFWQRS